MLWSNEVEGCTQISPRLFLARVVPPVDIWVGKDFLLPATFADSESSGIPL
jgi:hypothetical protein